MPAAVDAPAVTPAAGETGVLGIGPRGRPGRTAAPAAGFFVLSTSSESVT